MFKLWAIPIKEVEKVHLKGETKAVENITEIWLELLFKWNNC